MRAECFFPRHDDTEAHCAADSDRRRTAHGQRADGSADLVERREVAFNVFVREQPLVDNPDCALVRRPLYRMDGHEKKNTEC